MDQIEGGEEIVQRWTRMVYMRYKLRGCLFGIIIHLDYIIQQFLN
jgi:hypothetical protein